MAYRPQYVYPEPPYDLVEEEFEYFFDSNNVPALAVNPSNLIPLPLEKDAEYRFRGVQVSGNAGNLMVRFWTPNQIQLSQVQIEADLAYSGKPSDGTLPIGRIPVPLNDEIVCPAGSSLYLDIASQ